MKIKLKKRIALTTAFILAAVMAVGTGTVSKQVNADENLLIGEWTHVHDPYEANDVLIAATKVTANDTAGFTANISITGWQRNWYGVDEMPDDAWPYADGWADNPYQLRSYTTMQVTPKTTYQLTFDIENEMKSEVGSPTEKNVTITVYSGIEGDTDNTFLLTTARVAANGTFKFDRKFTVPESYKGDTVMIEIAYGSYAYSYSVSSSSLIKLMPANVIKKYCFAPGTTENVNAGGKLTFSNINVAETDYEEPTIEKPIVEAPTGNNTVIEPCTCNHAIDKNNVNKPSVKIKKPAKTVVGKIINVKGKKIKATWKKVSGASKYQIRAVTGKKVIKKTTSKLNVTLKNLKKNKIYKVSVRAYNSAGYGKWSKAKKVKITK